MNTVTLTPKTHKGKNIIRRHGTTWVVRAVAERVFFSTAAGPWLLVDPVRARSSCDKRWVHARRDDNFDVALQGDAE
jgi:hypothetical protein